MFVVSIDIGIHNMGTVFLSVDEICWETPEILEVRHDNIQKMSIDCHNPNCKSRHDRCFLDYIEHYFVECGPILEKSDVIVVERQPPGGFIIIQELILQRYRDKVKLIHPRSVHKFHGITGLDYDNRKLFTISKATKFLGNFDTFLSAERKHDIADALCQALYFVDTERLRYETERKVSSLYVSNSHKYVIGETTDIDELLRSCTYIPEDVLLRVCIEEICDRFSFCPTEDSQIF